MTQSDSAMAPDETAKASRVCLAEGSTLRFDPPRSATPPRVSVLMPVYNNEAFVEEACDTILNQSFSQFEIIAVDDGSSDGSWKKLQSLRQRDERIGIMTRPNTGIVGALNDALGQARGELIARMDGDDWSELSRFAKQVRYLDEHPDVVAVGSYMQRTDPDGNPVGVSKTPLEHEAIDQVLLTGNASPIIHATVMMRYQALRQAGAWTPGFNWVEDLDLFLRLAEVGRLANIPQVLYRYRRHFGSTCLNRFRQMVPLQEEVVRRAYQRRGIEGEPDFSHWYEILSRKEGRADVYHGWACHAIHQGMGPVARRHALAALRRRPWSKRMWKLMAWALAA